MNCRLSICTFHHHCSSPRGSHFHYANFALSTALQLCGCIEPLFRFNHIAGHKVRTETRSDCAVCTHHLAK